MSNRCLRALVGLASLWMAVAQSQEQPSLLLVLDASGSMWGQVEGKPKIAIARDVLGTVIGQMPDTTQSGLLAYGHRYEGRCDDIELLSPLGPLDKAELKSKVAAISPKGKTPLTAATQKAIDIARASKRPSTVVLVSDGLETCNADPCALVKSAKAQGVQFVLHVVGFDLGKENTASLQCAADAGGGRYFRADNAVQLSAALNEAVADSRTATGTLRVIAMEAGKPIKARVSALSKAGDAASKYSTVAADDPVFVLSPGEYQLSIRHPKLSVAPLIVPQVTVVANKETVHEVAFGTGAMRISITQNGKPWDATVKIYEQGGSTLLTSGISKNGVFTPQLNAGTYRVEAANFEIDFDNVESMPNVVVSAAQTANVVVDFKTVRVVVSATGGGKAIDARFALKRDAKYLTGGMLRASGAGQTKTLLVKPGRYSLSVTPRDRQFSEKNLELDLQAGQERAVVVAF